MTEPQEHGPKGKTARSLGLFFALALLISWALWAPLVSARLDGREAPTWLHLAGSLGPAIAALLTAAFLYGRRTTATLLRVLSPARLGRSAPRWRSAARCCCSPQGLPSFTAWRRNDDACRPTAAPPGSPGIGCPPATAASENIPSTPCATRLPCPIAGLVPHRRPHGQLRPASRLPCHPHQPGSAPAHPGPHARGCDFSDCS